MRRSVPELPPSESWRSTHLYICLLSSAPCGPDGSNLNILALLNKVCFRQKEGEVITPPLTFSLSV